MSGVDPFVLEAVRRLADQFAVGEWQPVPADIAKAYPNATKTLAATLRELNWQPPVDPDELAAFAVWQAVNDPDCVETLAGVKQACLNGWTVAITAYRAGKAAATENRS